MYALERLYQTRCLFDQGKISKEDFKSLSCKLLSVRYSEILMEVNKSVSISRTYK